MREITGHGSGSTVGIVSSLQRVDLVTSPPGEYIPVIDLTGPRHEVARAIDAACRESGFLVVTGHGVDANLIQRMHDVTLALFLQPAEWKQQWQPPADAAGLRGMHLVPSYVSAGEDIPTAPDLCELFTMCRLGEPEAARRAEQAGVPPAWRTPNIWPDRPAGLRETWLAYYAAMEVLASELLHLFALGLGLPEDHFDRFVDEHITNLTANYYPPVAAEPLPDQFRKGPHSDWGSLTILYQDGVGGLEVFDRRSGGWAEVPALPGTFVVNIGDLMARWTNDRWQSTKHRVRIPPPERRGLQRVSIPFFHHPNWDAVIECLPSCLGPDDEPRYGPVTAGDYLLQRVEATYR